LRYGSFVFVLRLEIDEVRLYHVILAHHSYFVKSIKKNYCINLNYLKSHVKVDGPPGTFH